MKVTTVSGVVPFCDECYAQEPQVDSPSAFRIELASADFTLDLCVKHKIELVTLLTAGHTPAPQVPPVSHYGDDKRNEDVKPRSVEG